MTGSRGTVGAGGVPAAGRLRDRPGKFRLALAAAYFAAVNWMLLAPADSFESVEFFPGEDKAVHGAVFLVLAVLVRRAVPDSLAAGTRALAVWGGLAAYASGIEALQPVLTGGDRRFEWLDLASNGAGLAAGWLLFAAAAARAAVPSTTEGRVR